MIIPFCCEDCYYNPDERQRGAGPQVTVIQQTVSPLGNMQMTPVQQQVCTRTNDVSQHCTILTVSCVYYQQGVYAPQPQGMYAQPVMATAMAVSSQAMSHACELMGALMVQIERDCVVIAGAPAPAGRCTGGGCAALPATRAGGGGGGRPDVALRAALILHGVGGGNSVALRTAGRRHGVTTRFLDQLQSRPVRDAASRGKPSSPKSHLILT